MEYKFNKIDEDLIIMFGCEDRITYSFSCSEVKFYIDDHLINFNYIPKNTFLTLLDQGRFQVKESKDFYLLQIFEIDSKEFLRCKCINFKMNEEIVNINSLVLPKFIELKDKTLEYLIGEIILVNKRKSKYILKTSRADLIKKKKLLNSIPKKIGNGIIFKISTELIWVKIDNNLNFSFSLPAFIIMNQIKSLETLINRKVSVYQINDREYFKLKKEKLGPSQSLKFEEFSKTFSIDMDLEFQNRDSIPNFVNEYSFDLDLNVRNPGLFKNEAEKHQNLSINENSMDKKKFIENNLTSEVFSNSSSLNKSKDHRKKKIIINPIYENNLKTQKSKTKKKSSRSLFFKTKKKCLEKIYSDQDLSNQHLSVKNPDFLLNKFSLQEFHNNNIFGKDQEVNPNMSYQEFTNNFVFKKDSEVHKNFIIQEFSNNSIFEDTGIEKKSLDIQEFRNEFISENEPKIDYSSHSPINKLRCLDFLNIFEKTKFNCNNFALSEPIMNKTLGSVIGLGIIEHLIKFKKDFHFKNLIENVFTKSGVSSLYNDILNIPNIKKVSKFNKNIQEFSVNIKRIGESILSLVEHDIETFEGIQELCNMIGCCIHFRNFTEGFTEIKIVPTTYQIKRRPIINIGKYFNDYFLLYTKDMVTAGGVYDKSHKPIINFPFYDEDLKNERKLLKSVLKGIMNRITEIKDYLIKKLSGTRAESVNYDFEDVAKLYKSYLYEKYNCAGAMKLENLIINLSFQNVIYHVTGKKFFCNCGCVNYFDEATHTKKTCYCRREYSLQHLNSKSLEIACTCQQMIVRDLLTISYNTII